MISSNDLRIVCAGQNWSRGRAPRLRHGRDPRASQSRCACDVQWHGAALPRRRVPREAVGNLCHPCDDCVPGQMCTRSGAYAGCHDCPEGLYDNDYEVMTACVDCPEGLTSHLGATSCEKDTIDALSSIIGLLGAIGGIGLSVSVALWGEQPLCDRCSRHDYSQVERDSEEP